jgi:hypothetical protein
VADLGGGPNGAAIGPDGHCYVCNNGGFEWIESQGRTYPGAQPDDYQGGSIQRVNLETGQVQTLYTHCDDEPLKGPMTSSSMPKADFGSPTMANIGLGTGTEPESFMPCQTAVRLPK